jgi:glucose-1-phosphate adenylyltransferase
VAKVKDVRQTVMALILGGGKGARLYPLTKLRAKPAVPIAGKYRLIDIPMSNCLNSGIHQIAILTQFQSVSLHRHIAATYNFDAFHPGWVLILAAEQTYGTSDWYQGTADAVRKQLFQIEATGAKYVLILAGDHLYRMDYSKMLRAHLEARAEISVAVKPIVPDDASRFGVLRLDDDNRCVAFVEKPHDPDVLADFVSRPDSPEPYLGSMGIYLFNTQTLFEVLDSDHDDFGRDILPRALETRTVLGYPFEGYWEDIGTIRSFYESNIGLTTRDSPFNFNDPIEPIYTRARFLPGSRIVDARLNKVLLAEGCLIDGAAIKHSVIGVRSIIAPLAIVEDVVMMGADYYEEEARRDQTGQTPIGIGPRSRVRGAILDKNARIGADVVIEPFPRGVDIDAENYTVRDGVVVVPKNAVIPDGSRITPNH